MAYPTRKTPSLKFSQTHPRVGHTIKNSGPVAAHILGTLILLPWSGWWLHEGDLERIEISCFLSLMSLFSGVMMACYHFPRCLICC